MSKFHKKEDIGKIEEGWQKICYFPSGDGIHYIHCCEICHLTSEEPKRILGGHYLCSSCKKKLKLPKDNTIIRWGNAQKKWDRLFPQLKGHPSEPSRKERQKTWKKLIKEDYIIEMFHKKFSSENRKNYII